MTLTTNVVESYREFLFVKYPTHEKKFCNLLKSSPQSAKAEAVIFQLLRLLFDDVVVAEDISTGGADFLCRADEMELIAEVTCLEAESVTKQSGWENSIPEDGSAGWFRMITHKVRGKASTKASQLSGYTASRVLVISCEHIASDVLIGPHGAEVFFTGQPRIAVPIGDPIDSINTVTDLRDSIFFDVNDGVVEPGRQSISATLLVSVFAHDASVVGILHPHPQIPLPVSLFPSAPFLRMRKGPPTEMEIETEWVAHKPNPWRYYHNPVVLKDSELRDT
jgi:hypothetical protein